MADRPSFAIVVRDRSSAWRRTAFLICGDWGQAEDLTQTVLLRMYLKWPSIDPNGVDAYARMAIARLAVDESRRPWRRRGMGPWPDGPPPCSEVLLSRLVTANGTVVDVQDGGGGGLIAEAFYPDRSLVMLSLHPLGEGNRRQGHEQIPLTVEQLAAVAADPGLSLTG